MYQAYSQNVTLVSWSWNEESVLEVGSCLPSVLVVAPPSKLFIPRTNCHRKSGRPPVPSAGDQFAGHVVELKAITAFGGTVYWIISFHLFLLRTSEVEAVSVA